MFWLRVLAIAQVAIIVRHHATLLERDERNRLAGLVAKSRGRPHKNLTANERGELLHLPEGQTVADYIRGLIQAGRLVVGIEGGESDLAYAIKVAGEQAFMFSSDFPHEVNTQTVKKEIRELREREEISEAAKQAILHGNAARFYNLAAAN